MDGINIKKDGSNLDSLRITDVEVKEGNTLIIRFSAPRKLKRYLHSDSFYVKYDRRVEDVPRSILYIPGVAGLITLCWAKKTNLYVEELDSSYLESLVEVRGVLGGFYPDIGFQSEILCDREADNSFRNSGVGLLFSGGFDSTALYIEHRDSNPTLFSIIGGVIPIENHAFIRKFKRTYSEFAEKEGVKLHFIETNIRDVINETLLWSEYREQLDDPWWELINQGIIYLSLCAPLTLRDVGCLRIASSGNLLIDYPYGTDPRIDNKIRWGDVDVVHSQVEYTKLDKICSFIKGFTEREYHPTLHICNYNPLISDELNCNHCTDCLCGIIRLLVAGIDPTMCGFEMSDDIYKKVKEDIIPNARWLFYWKNIQERIDLEENRYLHNSEEFFRWLKDADLEALTNPDKLINIEKIFLPIQAILPRVIQKHLLKAYYSWKYKV